VIWWEFLAALPVICGGGYYAARSLVHWHEGERQLFRREGRWNCGERCGYSFRYLGFGQWIGPFGAVRKPHFMNSREFQSEYSFCYAAIKWVEDPEEE
jgi:hypothetical protein